MNNKTIFTFIALSCSTMAHSGGWHWETAQERLRQTPAYLISYRASTPSYCFPGLGQACSRRPDTPNTPTQNASQAAMDKDSTTDNPSQQLQAQNASAATTQPNAPLISIKLAHHQIVRTIAIDEDVDNSTNSSSPSWIAAPRVSPFLGRTLLAQAALLVRSQSTQNFANILNAMQAENEALYSPANNSSQALDE